MEQFSKDKQMGWGGSSVAECWRGMPEHHKIKQEKIKQNAHLSNI